MSNSQLFVPCYGDPSMGLRLLLMEEPVQILINIIFLFTTLSLKIQEFYTGLFAGNYSIYTTMEMDCTIVSNVIIFEPSELMPIPS